MATERRAPGRPRSEASRQAILSAVPDLIGDGSTAVTMDRIAAHAGVGKQTIYRWWPTRADVLLEAVAAKADLNVPVSDHGSYADDLEASLSASYAMGRQRRITDLLRALMADAQIDPAFGERFRKGFLERRRQTLAVIVDRARERGDLPARPDPRTIADIVFGTIWYRMLASRRPLDGGLLDELLALLT